MHHHEELLMYAETARDSAAEVDKRIDALIRQAYQDKRTIQGYRKLAQQGYRKRLEIPVKPAPDYVSTIETDLKSAIEELHTLLDRATGVFPGSNIYSALQITKRLVRTYGLKTEPHIQQKHKALQSSPANQGITHPQLQDQIASGEVAEAARRALKADHRNTSEQPLMSGRPGEKS